MENANSLLVSIVIPALNEERSIGRCLESILEVATPGSEFEITCVDNGSSDRTPEIVRSFQDRCELRLLSAPQINVSAMRNLGAAHSRGEILAFVDADCTVPPGWFEHIVAGLDDKSVGAIGCTCRIPGEASWVARTWDLNSMTKRRAGDARTLPTGGLAVRSESFRRIDGFDETLISNEDFDLCYRLRDSGVRVVSDPAVSVTHWGVPGNIVEFFRREVWHGTHVLRVFLSDVRKLRNIKSIAYAALYAVTMLLLVLGIVLTATGRGHGVLLVSLMLLAAPAMALAVAKLGRSGPWRQLPGLAWIYLVYGVARAVSLLDFRHWFRRETA